VRSTAGGWRRRRRSSERTGTRKEKSENARWKAVRISNTKKETPGSDRKKWEIWRTRQMEKQNLRSRKRRNLKFTFALIQCPIPFSFYFFFRFALKMRNIRTTFKPRTFPSLFWCFSLFSVFPSYVGFLFLEDTQLNKARFFAGIHRKASPIFFLIDSPTTMLAHATAENSRIPSLVVWGFC